MSSLVHRSLRSRRALGSLTEFQSIICNERRTAAGAGFQPSGQTICSFPRLVQVRTMSDNLLGHSPMAQSVPKAVSKGVSAQIPTAQDITTSGGVWAPTSAKREKLTELKGELEKGQTLDDVATKEQQLNLWLIDGMSAIARQVDQVPAVASSDSKTTENEMLEWLSTRDIPAQIDQRQWESLLQSVSKKIDTLLDRLPTQACFSNIREYLDSQDMVISPEDDLRDQISAIVRKTSVPSEVEREFSQATLRFRLMLLQSVAQQLESAWVKLTTVTDQDIDRAAVSHSTVEKVATHLSSTHLLALLRETVSGTCQSRVDALWALIDRDQDGLLDEPEMNLVCQLAVDPVGKTLQRVLNETLELGPLYGGAEELGGKKPGWRARRQDRREKKQLVKMMERTTKVHFEDEVEMAHRLRCIYAWSNKAHQGNKIESVLVEESDFSIRKRYVELQPKISLAEFREVQQEHFRHLDRIGTEFLKSYREDVLVHQGKGRQKKELIRDCMAFLTVVCVADFFISTM